MTNSIFDKELTTIEKEIMGLVKCSDCNRVTAWTTCVMCGGSN
jgi:hypothetical protein